MKTFAKALVGTALLLLMAVACIAFLFLNRKVVEEVALEEDTPLSLAEPAAPADPAAPAVSKAPSSVPQAPPVQVVFTAENAKALPKGAVQFAGQAFEVWDTKNRHTNFVSSAPVTVPADGNLYAGISYLDEGYGQVRVDLYGADGKLISPDRFLDLQRSNSGKLVTGRMRFAKPAVSGTGPLRVRVLLTGGLGETLRVEKLFVQDKPFTDPKFAYLMTDPWVGVPTNKLLKAENGTMKGKVMVGYQGWFRTPNDLEGRGFIHWGAPTRGHFNIDMWPDVSEYPPHTLERAADVKLKSGKPAYLFSSTWPEVVDVHFRWMREHNIDGAYVQRFISGASAGKRPEWVLANVRRAAQRHGRLWAIEYDVSGGTDESALQILQDDWKFLVDTCGILKDPNYAREGDRPVVFLWGFSVPGRACTPPVANAVVDFFKSDPKYGGNYVIGGGHGSWRKASAEWQEHFRKYDSMLVWMSQAYKEDLEDFKGLGVTYLPHVKPGFSWANMQRIPTGDPMAYTPRDGGRFYWKLLSGVAQAGCDRLFVGMFDEYDESTAIMPMSDDAPPTPVQPGVYVEAYVVGGDADRAQKLQLPSVEVPLTTPLHKSLPAENVSIRIVGQVIPPVSGQYTFAIEGAKEDNVELFVDGQRILRTKIQGEIMPATTKLSLQVGKPVPFRLQYTHKTNPGTLRLHWECERLRRQPVPATALRDAWGRFLTNEGRDPKWWLKLTGYGREMINGQRPADSPMPER